MNLRKKISNLFTPPSTQEVTEVETPTIPITHTGDMHPNDQRVRNALKAFLRNNELNDVVIYYIDIRMDKDTHIVQIGCSNPGLLIGAKGDHTEMMRKSLWPVANSGFDVVKKIRIEVFFEDPFIS